MQTKSDTELLREYVTRRSEAAFGEIVHRYADLVHSAALRQVGDPEQARDVAQVVFADLARKAASLSSSTLLVGWLHRAARLAALEQLRIDRRRQRRERQAMDLHNSSCEVPSDWPSVRPVLDEAVARLGNEDRNALLLRFFKNESFASVGTALGVSADAAQKRVSRALDKLRELLAERGIKTTSAALSVALAANAVQPVPAGFAASLATGALADAAVDGAATASSAKLFSVSNMNTAILTLTIAAGLTGLTVLQANAQRHLREARALSQQQAAEIDALRTANAQLEELTNDLERLRNEAKDVLRLRGEVSRLRRDQVAQQVIVKPTLASLETGGVTNPIESQISIKTKFVLAPPGETSRHPGSGGPNAAASHGAKLDGFADGSTVQDPL